MAKEWHLNVPFSAGKSIMPDLLKKMFEKLVSESDESLDSQLTKPLDTKLKAFEKKNG